MELIISMQALRKVCKINNTHYISIPKIIFETIGSNYCMQYFDLENKKVIIKFVNRSGA